MKHLNHLSLLGSVYAMSLFSAFAEREILQQQCSMHDGVEVCSVTEDFNSSKSYRITDFGVEQNIGGSPEEQRKTQSVISTTLRYMNSIDESTRANCKNTHELCSFWASLNECVNNPNFMLKGCAPACSSCSGRIDPAFASTSLQNSEKEDTYYGEPQTISDNRVQKLLDETPAYLNTIDNVDNCKNQHELCSYWAVIGECERNQSYMKTSCAPACRSCHLIDFDTRCPALPESENPSIYKRGDMHMMFTDIATGSFNEFRPMVHVRPDVRVDTQNDSSNVILGESMPWVVTFDSFLTDEECDKLIALGYAEGYERSKDVGNKKADGSYDGYESQSRTSENAWCSKDTCANDPVVKSIMKKIERVTGVPESNSEYLQILRYEGGQFYKAHHDYIKHQQFRNGGPRILTFFLYLSDVEEGGGTRFPHLDVTVLPKKGKALLWPSVLSDDPFSVDVSTRHEALPVVKGVKFAANAWLHLKDYRAAHELGCA